MGGGGGKIEGVIVLNLYFLSKPWVVFDKKGTVDILDKKIVHRSKLGYREFFILFFLPVYFDDSRGICLQLVTVMCFIPMAAL